MEPGRTAVGTWSGGRYIRFGEEVAEGRLAGLLRPDGGDGAGHHASGAAGISTVLTADTYGAGEADRLLGRALEGVARDSYSLVGSVGHDFYEGERDGPRGFPRFTDPRLRGPAEYADYLHMATERSLERIGVESFDLLLLHNPDRRGFEREEVWSSMAALRDSGLTRQIGVAPGPANGFTLDLIGCLERFGELLDWAMIILNPFEPWPGELVLHAARRHDVSLITRVVDYGGLFWDDVLPGHEFAPGDHRGFRTEGWIEAGREKLDRIRPIAERTGLTPLQLACQWNLAHDAVECVVPTLIQEPGPHARAIEEKRAELAALPAEQRLSGDDMARIREVGDNAGSMTLKGASPEHEGDERPDRWPVTPELSELASRWGIDPDHDLRKLEPSGSPA